MWLVAVLAVSFVHPFVTNSRWLMVHLVVLGALTHAAMVWSTHFSQALLKTSPDLDPAAVQRRRALLLAAGVATVLSGVMFERVPVTVTGAVLVAVAVIWHGIQLGRRWRAAATTRFRITVGYYVVAAGWLPVGAALGVLLARGPDDTWRGRLVVAHIAALALGWVGSTVLGTLVTLWPTMLRTRIDARAESFARQALLPLNGALAGVVAAALLGQPRLVGAALAGWLLAAGWWGRALPAPARRRPPVEFAALSVTASLAWAAVLVGGAATALLLAPSWPVIAETHGRWTAVLAVGVAPQLLIGALSYLVPVVLGGRPRAVRAANATMGRLGVPRLVLVNGGLLLALLPVPSVVRVVVTTLALAALAAFLPLLALAIRDSRRHRVGPSTRAVPASPPASPPGSPPGFPQGRPLCSPHGGGTGLIAGLATLGVAIALAVSIDPVSAGLPLRPDLSTGGTQVAATGHTTTVAVQADGMRFHPSSISVPAGDRLVIELTNTDRSTTHDLVLANGVKGPRLQPGRSATVDVGVVGADLAGWCSIVGHRQMGMTMSITAVGAPPAPDLPPVGAHGASAIDLHTGDQVEHPVDPVLPSAPPPGEHHVTLTVREVNLEVAPGVWQRRWTYNGQVPGPTLRGSVGDVFVITLINDGSLGHSIDFHAGALAPDTPMRTIPPGESLTYRFTATRSGIWMYHCSTMPMSAHIAAGMHGAVVIDPPGLPPVDREYLLIQSEAYLHSAGDHTHAEEVDPDHVSAEAPTAVVFNGIANQYDHAPLTATVGERVRIWVLDAGPNRPSAFHVVGAQFDTTYLEGGWQLRPGRDDASGGSQVLGLQPAQGGFVELTFPEAGHYPVVSHLMVDAERGAHGVVEVTDPPPRS